VDDRTRIIRKTAPSFAYLFWLTGTRRGEVAHLDAAGTTVGRGGDSQVVLEDDSVSEEQATIRKEDGAWYLYDLASTNTTAVGGESVYRRALSDGDRITVGESELAFRVLG